MQMQALKRGAEQRTSPGPAASLQAGTVEFSCFGGSPPNKTAENNLISLENHFPQWRYGTLWGLEVAGGSYGASGYGEPDWPIRARVWHISSFSSRAS